MTIKISPMKFQYLTILFIILCSLPCIAQKRGKCSEEEFRAKKQAYIAEKAKLTEEEIQHFFPLYFELQNKKKAINQETWGNIHKGNDPETNESEYETIIDNIFNAQQAITELEKEYIQKYRKFISNEKLYMIYRAEIKFNRNMMKILQKIEKK